MKFNLSSISEAGPTRDENQDYVLVDEELGLFILCDGMGGAKGGQVASSLAADTVRSFVSHHIDELKESQTSRAIRRILIEAVESAAKVVYGKGTKDPSLEGMGTTLTALLVVENLAVMAHVGDSRLYLYREGILRLLSNDHRLVEELVQQGAMSAEQAERSPYRHVLSRALGPQPAVTVDTMSFELLPKDKLLLCSDGLLEIFDDENSIASAVAEKAPEKFTSELSPVADKKLCSDNYSAIILEVEEAEASERTDETLLKLSSLQSLYLFRSLDPRALIRLVERAYVLKANEGDVLIREGEVGDSLFVILAGEVEVSFGSKSLTTLSKANHFGEMSMLSGLERSATVKAAGSCKVLKLDRTAIEEIAKEDLRAGLGIYKALSRELSIRLKESNRRLSDLGAALKG